MKSSEYWQKRFSLLEDSRHNAGAEIYKTIERQYQRAKKEIESEISRWYRRIADNNGVSMAEARKLLKADELKEFHWGVDEYIKYGEEHEISGEWAKELENASAKFHISRLEALEINTRQSVEALYGKQQTLVSDFLGETYKSDYYHTAFELQKGFEIGFDIGTVNDDYLQKVLYKPWAPDGSNFSDRIWTNKDKLLNEIHTELTQSILTGADPQKAIDAISHDLDVSKANAGRLVMTESAYFGTLAQQDCFNDLGVEEYEIVATLDDRTSAICQSMDGQHFPMKDFEAGVSAPPFHVNCRSCTCPYFDDEFSLGGERAARGEDGEVYYVPADMTYPEWKEAFVDGGSKEEFGLGSGKVGDHDDYSEIELIRDIDYNDKEAVAKELKAFSEKYINSDVEHAYVISPNNKLYEIRGGPINVNIALSGEDALKDSIVIHNHPGIDGDSFSRYDFRDYFNFGIKDLYVVNYLDGKKSIQKMTFLGERLTYAQANKAYLQARNQRWQEVKDAGIAVEIEQLETMTVLEKTFKNLIFEVKDL